MNRTPIQQRLDDIRGDIFQYSPHPERVRIVAVSKKQSLEKMRAAVAAGISDLGENRIQDALVKFELESFPGIRRHFIGYLQSNKVNKCLQNFNWLHSLQTDKIARMIADSGREMICLIEVNISGESNKSGLAPEDVIPFLKSIREYKGLEVRGLMGMAALTEDEKQIRSSFSLLRSISESCKFLENDSIRFEELSMGMTHDYRIALREGATLLRIGTGIFGPRGE
jgi:PLP dependent protein